MQKKDKNAKKGKTKFQIRKIYMQKNNIWLKIIFQKKYAKRQKCKRKGCKKVGGVVFYC